MIPNICLVRELIMAGGGGGIETPFSRFVFLIKPIAKQYTTMLTKDLYSVSTQRKCKSNHFSRNNVIVFH